MTKDEHLNIMDMKMTGAILNLRMINSKVCRSNSAPKPFDIITFNIIDAILAAIVII